MKHYGATLSDEERLLPREQSINVIHSNDSSTSNFRGRSVVISLILALAVTVSIFGVNIYTSHVNTPEIPVYDTFLKSEGLKPQTTSLDLSITASNEYGAFTAPYPWMDDVPGTQLVEPYKTTTLSLSGSYAVSGQYSYEWIISGVNEDYTSTSFSSKTNDLNVLIRLHEPGRYAVKINVFDKSNSYVTTYKTRLVCKYVKREIRSLTNEDRINLLDAMATLWTTDDHTGKKQYGEKYTSMNTFAAVHLQASNDLLCDEFHEGSGFLTHHLALTTSFEASVRSVNPAVTLPYWDFTIEGETILNSDKNPSYLLQISDIFTEKWFGAVDEKNHIVDGHWAHATVPKASSTNDLQNAYGYVRSYWNSNSDPEISRHLFDFCGVEPVTKKIPSCESHFDVLNSANLGELQLLSPNDGHGPMHVQIGGVWGGCTDGYKQLIEKWKDYLGRDMTEDEINATGIDLDTFYETWGKKGQRRVMFDEIVMGDYDHIYRSLYRSHICAADNTPTLLQCPTSCDSESECTCRVDKLTNGETTWDNIFPCVLTGKSNQNLFLNTMSEDFLKDMITFISTSSVKEGEMVESASPVDPIFWLIHPVIDRLVAAKRLPSVSTMGSKQFSKWTTAATADDWVQYSKYDLKPKKNAYHPEAYTCKGHAATDPALPTGTGKNSLPYTSAIESVADLDNDGVISNFEYFQAIDPSNIDGNDYVYDNFEWSHCA